MSAPSIGGRHDRDRRRRRGRDDRALAVPGGARRLPPRHLALELVFGARVYRQPRRLVGALAPAVAVFVAWDVIAIDRGHWSYNARYVTGWRLPGALPVEELAFFVAVPMCALLTYEAVKVVLGAAQRPAAGSTATPAGGTRAMPRA